MVIVTNPCESTTLDIASLVLNTTNLTFNYYNNSLPPVVQITTLIKDTASETYGNNDGYTLCDTRAPHLIDNASNLEVDLSGSTGITLSGNLLTFDLKNEGTFTYNL